MIVFLAAAAKEKDAYNFFLSQLQIRVVMAFGRLMNKWRIFK